MIFNDTKIQKALDDIEFTRKSNIINTIKGNIKAIETDVQEDPLGTAGFALKGIFEICAELDKQNNSDSHQKLFGDLETMLKEAISEHVKILLDNAKETVETMEEPIESSEP